MSTIMATIVEAKPKYSLKPKKLLKLDLDWNIDPIMAWNLIWICETQKVTYILLVGKCKNKKMSILLCLHPFGVRGFHCLVMGELK
jgi:hypothetical protein